MSIINSMSIQFSSIAQNESFARVVISAFASQLDPTIDELQDIKMAVSEAVTNAIVHGYDGDGTKTVSMAAKLCNDGEVCITIADSGVGIADLEQAREPFYTSRPELERSGMGFTVMESFMDGLVVESRPGEGTKVIMRKKLNIAKGSETFAETLGK